MSNIDDLFKGMQMFHDGLQQYQVGQAVNDASAQLAKLNSQQLDKQTAYQQASQIQNQLAMRLGASGADAMKIQAMTHNIAPSQGEMYQGELSTQQEASKNQMELTKEGMANKSAERVAQIHADALSGGKVQKAYDDVAKQFDSRKDIKDVVSNFSKLDDSLNQLDATQGKAGSSIFANLAKIGLVKNANGGRPSQQEFQSIDDSPAWFDKVRKSVGLATTGKYPSDLTSFWKDVLTRTKQNNMNFLDKAITGHAQSAAELNQNLDADRIQRALKSRYSNIFQNQSGQNSSSAYNPVSDKQQKIEFVKQWLKSSDAKVNADKAQKATQWLKSQGVQ